MIHISDLRILFKSDFAYDLGLAGVMTWSIDTDDFLGMCGGPKFPLLRTINHALYRREKGILSKASISLSSSTGLLIAVMMVLGTWLQL